LRRRKPRQTGETYRPSVTIIKQRQDKKTGELYPTVIELYGMRYILQHPDQYKR